MTNWKYSPTIWKCCSNESNDIKLQVTVVWPWRLRKMCYGEICPLLMVIHILGLKFLPTLGIDSNHDYDSW